MAVRLPNVPSFPTLQTGDKFRLRVAGARSCDAARTVARLLVANGYAAEEIATVATQKGATCGAVSLLIARRSVSPGNVRTYANLVGASDPPASVFVEGESSDLLETIADAATLGPLRRAARSGIAAAREAPSNAADAAREFVSGAGESISSVTTPISIAVAVLAFAAVVLAVVWLLRR